MAIDQRLDQRNGTWRLNSQSRQVGFFVTAVLLVGAILAAALDLADADSWDPVKLQAWTLVSQFLVAAGLLLLGRWRRSTSFKVMAFLISLIIVEEALHVLNPVSAWLADLVQIDNTWTTVRSSVLNGLLIYGLVAALGMALLIVSHWQGSPGERLVVRNLAVMLFVAGFFGGPISTMSNFGNVRMRMVIEEGGEGFIFALMAGYVAALLALDRSSSASSSWRGRR